MNNTLLHLSVLLLTMIVGLSCNDQGDVVNYLEIIDVQPAPNSTQVDKAATVIVRLNRGVALDQGEKIQLRYIDDTASVRSYSWCGMTPPINEWMCTGPFIWKPGKTVEVTIPKEISDPEGNLLKQSLIYRFTIAQDTVPFDLVSTQPAQGDTFSIGVSPRILFGSLTFNDYTVVRESTLTINPQATLWMSGRIIVDGRDGPTRLAWFTVRDMQPFTTYTITVPRTINDFEGETLSHDYHLVFHTKP
jgi:hypothetical protein